MSQKSYTHKYSPMKDVREKNLFKEEYFSSTDVDIYFDDKKQTEIGYISFTLSEQIKPIYGYASRTWDDIAIGNRIVSGEFTMPIGNSKEENFVDYDSIIKDINADDTDDEEDTPQKKYNNVNKTNHANKEWIGSTDKYTEPSSYYSKSLFDSDEDRKYISIMSKQGFAPKSDKSEDIKKAIKAYQKSKKIEQNGKFTTITKEKLDEDASITSSEVFTLDRANGYAVPRDDGISRSISGSFVVESIFSGYAYIQNIETGKHYYVKEASIPQ